MSGNFFNVLIGDELITMEKNRVIEIEPAHKGTKITLEASHLEEEPFIYFTNQAYEDVMKSYTS